MPVSATSVSTASGGTPSPVYEESGSSDEGDELAMLRDFIRGPLGVYSVAVLLYLFSAWLHFPYGGGHIYSDLVSVFQVRECPSGCTLQIPYIQTFVEYPVIVAMFMYAMGVLGRLLSSSDILDAYYLFTCAFLLIPTLLLVRESVKITKLLGVDDGRVMRYIVVTPSFLIMLLLNWYVIGVFFSRSEEHTSE